MFIKEGSADLVASNSLLKRTITSACLIFICALVLSRAWLTGAAVTLLIARGLYEFFRMLEAKEINVYKYFGIATGTLIPLSIILHFALTRTWELFLIVLTLLILILMQFRRRQASGVVTAISTTIFGILYVAWFLSFLIKIRYLPNGLGLLVTLLLIAKCGDIGAYLFGTRFGKTALIPHISPHKSVEGALGGLLFSTVAGLMGKNFLPYSYAHLFFLGIFFGILAQLGDLSESLIKRDCGVKDSGNILPGMGGVLDLLDSLIFTAPVFYFYMVIPH